MEDEDKLLYGDDGGGGEKDDEPTQGGSGDTAQDEDTVTFPEENAEEGETQNEFERDEEEDEEDEDEDEDSDDDNVQIVIDQGKIEEAKTTATFGIKPSSRQLPSERRGRFNVEDFDQVGTIDGTTAHEVDLENIEDKPWRKPGADITDYFNYGFTEDTWAAYCSRQKRMRVNESGVGMPGNPNQKEYPSHHGSRQNFDSKSQNGGTIPILGNKLNRPPPTMPTSSSSASSGAADQSSQIKSEAAAPAAPSGISVLTADKRRYSQKIFNNMDFSAPPPGFPPQGMNVPPPTSIPPPNFQNPPPFTDENFDAFEENYEGGYEPTQESQWVAPPSTYLGDRPTNSDAPPGDAAFDEKTRDPWQRANGGSASRGVERRYSRDQSPGRDQRKRRRSRSRSREHSSHRYRDYRDRGDRDRGGGDRDRDRGDRDVDRDTRDKEQQRDRGDRDVDRDTRDKEPRDRGDRDIDRDRGERSRRRSRSRDRDRERRRSRSPTHRDSKSPSSSHKHKKSKREKRDKPDREIKKEIKDEPEDYAE